MYYIEDTCKEVAAVFPAYCWKNTPNNDGAHGDTCGDGSGTVTFYDKDYIVKYSNSNSISGRCSGNKVKSSGSYLGSYDYFKPIGHEKTRLVDYRYNHKDDYELIWLHRLGVHKYQKNWHEQSRFKTKTAEEPVISHQTGLRNVFSDNIHKYTDSFMTTGQSSFNIARSIAELVDIKSTIDMFRLHKRNLRPDSQYLGYSFGISPLISDAIKLQKALLNFKSFLDKWNDAAIKLKVQRYAMYVPNQGEINDTFKYSGWISDQASVKLTSYSKMQERTNMYLYVQPMMISEMNSYYAFLGLNETASIAWNLVPFSFIIDWISNVGDVIDRLTFKNSLKFEVVGAGVSYSLSQQLASYGYIRGHNSVTLIENNRRFFRHPVRIKPGSTIKDLIKIDQVSFKPEIDGSKLTLLAALATSIFIK